jgi:mitochondrial chaperone BCS1
MLLAWVSSQSFAQDSIDPSSPWSERVSDDIHPDGSMKKPLHYTPWNGRFYFWYRSHLLEFRRIERKGEPIFFGEEDVSISCFGRSSKILKNLLDECRHHYLGLARNKTPVFEHQLDRWKPSKARELRPISTVVFDEHEKEVLLNDIRSFLDQATRGWYAVRGIPYRRGYLLYGPAGTGKSGLTLSIAGCFDLDVYILSLSSVGDSGLKSLFSELPQHYVILLEDVEATGQTRSQGTETVESGHQTVILSGLLNALDGVASQANCWA